MEFVIPSPVEFLKWLFDWPIPTWRFIGAAFVGGFIAGKGFGEYLQSCEHQDHEE